MIPTRRGSHEITRPQSDAEAARAAPFAHVRRVRRDDAERAPDGRRRRRCTATSLGRGRAAWPRRRPASSPPLAGEHERRARRRRASTCGERRAARAILATLGDVGPWLELTAFAEPDDGDRRVGSKQLDAPPPPPCDRRRARAPSVADGTHLGCRRRLRHASRARGAARQGCARDAFRAGAARPSDALGPDGLERADCACARARHRELRSLCSAAAAERVRRARER